MTGGLGRPLHVWSLSLDFRLGQAKCESKALTCFKGMENLLSPFLVFSSKNVGFVS